MNHYVYLLRSDRHHYVGIRSCQNSVERDSYMGSGYALACAKKVGIEFQKTVLCVCSSRKEAAEVEAALVTERDLLEPGCLNLMTGGGSIGLPGRKTIERLRLAWTPERKEANRDRMIGNKHGCKTRRPETRERIARAKRGVPRPDVVERNKSAEQAEKVRRSWTPERRAAQAERMRQMRRSRSV